MSSCIRCVGGIKMSYNEHLSYDQNGNIITLTRNGDLDSDTSVIAIDNLIYNYDAMYRLKKVVDFTGNPSGFKEGADNEDEYGYDKYGNMIRDDNKDITSITYNHLNLPKKVVFGNGNDITYLYNALGQKLLKQVTDNTTTITTEYQSGFHYENYGLKFFATAEGYAGFSTRGFYYAYNYTDHLGNVRLSYVNDRLLGVRVIEENNYYPFGLKHNGYNNISPPNSVYKYKYNGKELQDELGLNVYDFGARNYMPDLGRWANIDPLAEQSRRWTPYNYAYNNPVYFIDPDGMQSDSNSGSGGQNLSNDDFDVMVDMGYGRKMSASKIAGAVGFSGAKVQLSESGEMKFAFAAARDALNLVSEALNNGDNGGGSGGGEDRPFGQPDFEQSSQSSEANLLEFSDNLDGQPRMIGGAGALEYISVGGIVKGVNLLKNIFTAIKGGKKTIWVYGSFKSSSKWANQLAKRG